MLKTMGMGSTYRMTKWRDMESAMAPMSRGFCVGGMTKRDWFSETEFKAFSISIVTKTDRAMVMGWGSPNTAQVHSPSSIKANLPGSTVHCIK